MKESLKKLALASAVSAGVGGFAGSANAIIQGEPGDALLVPLVVYSDAGTPADTTDDVDTLIGLTFPRVVGTDPVPTVIGHVAPGASDTYTTARWSGAASQATDFCTDTVAGGAKNRTIHWFFFNEQSVHLVNSTFKVTCEDFYPFSWKLAAENVNALAAITNVNGYLVFSDQRATLGSSSAVPMFADAAQVRGVWDSAAYIPVIPLVDGADDASRNLGPSGGSVGAAAQDDLLQGVDEVVYDTLGVPAAVSPLTAGMPLDNDDGSNAFDYADFDMRYYLDPGLSATTTLVVWMDRNCAGGVLPGFFCDRRTVPVDVYDSNEVSVSDTLDLSLEVNVIEAGTLNGTIHSNVEDLANPTENAGHIFVRLPEATGSATGADYVGQAGNGPDSAGVAFSLIFFTSGDNPNQVQTALAHERGTAAP